MRKLCSGLLCLIALSASLGAQPRIFIVPMSDGFDSFLAAALLDNKVPVTITVDECSASYIIVGQAVRGQNKWYDTVFGTERDRNQGSIKLLKVSEKTVAWAGAAGDRSLWWGSLKSGGQKKVANRLARELKKEYFNKVLPAENPQGPCTPTASLIQNENKATETIRTSNIRVTSKPDGAEVLLNGKVMGNTPVSLSVKSGEWTVTVKRQGLAKWERFVRVSPGETLDLDVSL